MNVASNIFTTSRALSGRVGLTALWQRAANYYVWQRRPLYRAETQGKQIFQAVGLARSGTTLLGSLIHNHPDALCLSEPYRSWYLHGFSAYSGGRWYGAPTALIEALCHRREETWIGVKETYYSSHHDSAHANDRFFKRNCAAGVTTLGILRDPRDAYASVENRIGARCEVPERFTASWLEFAEWAREEADLLVRYEDLVTRPEEVMQNVCNALGLPFDPVMLRPSERAGEGDPRALSGQRISSASVGRFAERLAPEKVQEIEAHCGRVMKEMGYAVRSA